METNKEFDATNVLPNQNAEIEAKNQNPTFDALPESEEDNEVDYTDYSTFSKEELAAKAEQVLRDMKASERPSFKKIDETFRRLKENVDKINNEERETAKEKFKADNQGEEEGFDFKQNEAVTKFYECYKAIRDTKKKFFEKIEGDKAKNLAAKKEILEKIKTLIDASKSAEETNTLKEDYEKMKAYQAAWKGIGAVPQQEADNLYQTYKALVDRFYDEKKLERELLELGLERNFDAKMRICDKADELLGMENVNDAIKILNKLHQDFKSIGGVPKEKQEEIWQRFKNTSDKLYERKRTFTEGFKKELEENMKRKQELCLQVESFADYTSDRIKEWNEKTKEILAIQKEWDAVGAAPKEVARSLNKQFWKNFKSFFQNKAEFFEKIEAERSENLRKKEELCIQAEQARESNDWEATAEIVKQLQEDWKKIGTVPDAQRDTIFVRFKAACDAFFDRKRNRKNETFAQYEENYKQKQEICDQIEALIQSKEQEVAKLEAFIKQYEAIGEVPRKVMEKAQERFSTAIDAFLENLTISEEEKIKLQISWSGAAGAAKPIGKLKKKESTLQRRISTLESDISLWKNNIEFFASSKTADKLRVEFNDKIAKAQQEIADLKKQTNLIQKSIEEARKAERAEKR